MDPRSSTGPDAPRKSVTVPLTSGWPGYVLSAVVVAARAFQPGAEPVSAWSWWSWLLMLAPVLLPVYSWAAVGGLWLLARAALAAAEAAFGRKR